MCGIVGYTGFQDSAEVLVDGLRKLEYRGYDSAGISVFEDGEIKTVKAKGRLDDMVAKICELNEIENGDYIQVGEIILLP